MCIAARVHDAPPAPTLAPVQATLAVHRLSLPEAGVPASRRSGRPAPVDEDGRRSLIDIAEEYYRPLDLLCAGIAGPSSGQGVATPMLANWAAVDPSAQLASASGPVIAPDDAAARLLRGLREDRFVIFSHPQVRTRHDARRRRRLRALASLASSPTHCSTQACSSPARDRRVTTAFSWTDALPRPTRPVRVDRADGKAEGRSERGPSDGRFGVVELVGVPRTKAALRIVENVVTDPRDQAPRLGS
jgi:hypothetical protein